MFHQRDSGMKGMSIHGRKVVVWVHVADIAVVPRHHIRRVADPMAVAMGTDLRQIWPVYHRLLLVFSIQHQVSGLFIFFALLWESMTMIKVSGISLIRFWLCFKQEKTYKFLAKPLFILQHYIGHPRLVFRIRTMLRLLLIRRTFTPLIITIVMTNNKLFHKNLHQYRL